MRRNWMLVGPAAAVLAVLGWAWHDGGREPVHTIVQPVPVPELAR